MGVLWAAAVMGVLLGRPHVQVVDIFANWRSGAEGFAEAQQQHQTGSRPLVLYFYTDWCPYCRRLERDFFAAEEAQRYFAEAIPVRINPEQGASERAIANRYGVTGYPSFFIVPSGSTQPTRIHPFRQEGQAMTVAEFVKACEEASGAGRAVKRWAPKPPRRVRQRTPAATTQTTASPATDQDAQAWTHPVTLHLRNGGVITGELVRETPGAVTVGLEYGEVVFQRTEIERIVEGTEESP